MARAILRRALSLSAAASAPAPATPRVAAAFASTSSSSSAIVPPRSPLDDRLHRLLRSEITYIAERRPPYPPFPFPAHDSPLTFGFPIVVQPPRSFKSFAVEDRPGEQWVRLRAARGGAEAGEEVKVEATMFDGATEPLPEDAPLFHRVESLERGPRLHLSLIVEVTRADRVLGFICSAWPDELAVRHVLTLKASADAASTDGARGGRNFEKLGAEEREAVTKFLKEREVDEELAGFLHDYMANKEKMEFLRWLKTVESFLDK